MALLAAFHPLEWVLDEVKAGSTFPTLSGTLCANIRHRKQKFVNFFEPIIKITPL